MSKQKPTKTASISNSAALIIVALIGLIGTFVSAILAPFINRKLDAPPTPTTAITPTAAFRDWYAVFELKFPSGYWSEGIHSYIFDARCPFDINSTGADEATYSFTADHTTTLQNSTVYIRRKGLYLGEIETTTLGDALNPLQETAAVYTPYAFTFEDAQRLLNECQVQIRIDHGAFIPLTPLRVDKIAR